MTFRKLSFLATFAVVLAGAYFAFNLSAQAPAPGQEKANKAIPTFIAPLRTRVTILRGSRAA